MVSLIFFNYWIKSRKTVNILFFSVPWFFFHRGFFNLAKAK